MVSIQDVLDFSARKVRQEQKVGRRRIQKQKRDRRPIGPLILEQRMEFRQTSDLVGARARDVSPNMPKKKQVIVQVNNRKFGE